MIDFSEYTVLLILVTAGLIFYIAAWIQAKYPPKKNKSLLWFQNQDFYEKSRDLGFCTAVFS
jgi:hypothetical protein